MAQQDSNGSGRRDAGDQLAYTYRVTNSSSVTLSAIAVTDGSATAPIRCPATTLAAGAVMTCTSAHVISQADMDSGTITSAAPVVTSTAPGGVVVRDVGNAAVTSLPELASLSSIQSANLVRDRNHNGLVNPGDAVVYHLSVVNTGNVTISSLVVHDGLLSRYGLGMVCSPTSLKPGQRSDCTVGALNVNAGQASRGSLVNYATPAAVTARGTAFVGATTTTTLTLQITAGTTPPPPPVGSGPSNPPTPRVIRRLDLAQYRISYDDVNGNGALTAGETMRLGFTATNAGTTTLYAVSIVDGRMTDDKFTVACATTTLAPGQSTTCATTPISITKPQAKVKGPGFGTNFAYATARDASMVTVRSNTTSLFQGYFITDLRVSALPSTGSQAAGVPALAGLGLIAFGGLILLVSRGPGRSPLRRSTYRPTHRRRSGLSAP